LEPDRLAAFSDGVIAVIITIMVLELRPPAGTDLLALKAVLPVFLSYVLSFVYVAIYWNNHHHLFHVARQVSGAVLWANLHLLFWLSVIPFVTNWMGEHYGAPWPVALYGFVLMMCGSAYYVLTLTLIAVHGRNSAIAKALGTDLKGKLSVVIYLIALGLAFIETWLSLALYAVVALIWIVPDRRIEKHIED